MKYTLFVALIVMAWSPLAQDRTAGQKKKMTPADQTSKSDLTLTQQQREAIAELEKAARFYRAGRFTQAQQHAEKALELDPVNKTAPAFIARSIHAQYRPGVETPENIGKAREAIAAYQRILMSDPLNEEAYKAVAALYGAIKEDELQRDWIMQRAYNGSIPNDKRAEAFVVLASKDWNCSYEITEQPENKETVTKDGKALIVLKKPQEQTDFDKAQQCVMRGLELAEAAISLDPENESAWSFKTNLLLEAAKLAEMVGQDDQKAEYRKQADETQKRTTELSMINQRKSRRPSSDGSSPQPTVTLVTNDDPASTATVEPPPPPPTPDPSWRPKAPVSGGVLNGKAIFRPDPVYPETARAARASGTVTVQVTIDENGDVISARAVSGHPLLQAAAVEASRQAKFAPTSLSGQPVKVTGVLTYNFTVQ